MDDMPDMLNGSDIKIIVYHGVDADGWLSCIILNHFLTGRKIFVPMNYKKEDQNNLDNVVREVAYSGNTFEIHMADYTATDEFMSTWADKIYHYDHHVSRLEPRAGWRDKLLGDYSQVHDHERDVIDEIVRSHAVVYPKTISSAEYRAQEFTLDKPNNTFVAGCELVWLNTFWKYHHLPMPNIVDIVGRRDVWDHAGKGPIEMFGTGLLFKLKEHANINDTTINKLVEDRAYTWSTFGEAIPIVVDNGTLAFFDKLNRNNKEAADAFICRCIAIGENICSYLDVVNYHKSLDIPIAKLNINGEDRYVAYCNGQVGNDMFREKYKQKYPKVTIFLGVYIDATGDMVMGCRSIHDDHDALGTWDFIEYNLGLDGVCRISKGGHKSACGGRYAGHCLTRVMSFMHEHACEKPTDVEFIKETAEHLTAAMEQMKLALAASEKIDTIDMKPLTEECKSICASIEKHLSDLK